MQNGCRIAQDLAGIRQAALFGHALLHGVENARHGKFAFGRMPGSQPQAGCHKQSNQGAKQVEITSMYQNVTARVFKLSHGKKRPDEKPADILAFLKSALSDELPAQERRMKLNKQDPDEDLLASYSWGDGKSSLFGLMMRLIPATSAAALPPELFNRLQITLGDLNAAGQDGRTLCIEHYYFMLDSEHLITTLPRQRNIGGFQTYINWLIRAQRKETIFSFDPVAVMPRDFRIGQIKRIEIGDNARIIAEVGDGKGADARCFASSINKLKAQLLKALTERTSAGSMDDFDWSELVSAKIVLNLRKKPEGFSDEAFANAMGTIMKPVTDDLGIRFYAANGRKLSGSDILLTKAFEVEKTSQDHVNEEQLMLKFDDELGRLCN